ncbi:MAG: serine/threonine-protein phosphatase [Phycisphaerales bacterium]|nr:serine/threonine-protein phosphatase [Phycisphaerales bacterium]
MPTSPTPTTHLSQPPVGEIRDARTDEAPHTMQCMEIWGGNGVVERAATMPGVDMWVYSRPHRGENEGGDIHYISSCGTGRIGRVILADVSGHGGSAAALAVKLRDIMRRFVNFVEHGPLVSRLNREFGSEAKLGKFATAIVATYFAPSSVLVLCNAGHPRPLIYSTRTKRWRVLDAQDGEARVATPSDGGAGGGGGRGENISNAPLGVIEDSEYFAEALRMSDGDIVILYTDALMEARKPGSPMLGEHGLLGIVERLGVGNPETLAQRLVASVREYAGGIELDDDSTALVLQINSRPVKYSLMARIRSNLRFLGMIGGSFIGRGSAPWPELSRMNIVGSIAPWVSRGYRTDAKVNGE